MTTTLINPTVFDALHKGMGSLCTRGWGVFCLFSHHLSVKTGCVHLQVHFSSCKQIMCSFPPTPVVFHYVCTAVMCVCVFFIVGFYFIFGIFFVLGFCVLGVVGRSCDLVFSVALGCLLLCNAFTLSSPIGEDNGLLLVSWIHSSYSALVRSCFVYRAGASRHQSCPSPL